MSSNRYNHKSQKGNQRGIAAIFLLACSFIILVSFLFPALTGQFGHMLHSYLIRFSGWGSIVIPFYFGWMGRFELSNEKKYWKFRDSMLFLVLFLFTCAFLTFAPVAEDLSNRPGGLVGKWVYQFLVNQFGTFLSFLFSAAAIVCAGLLLFGLSPLFVLNFIREKIKKDIEEWKQEKKLLEEKNNLKKKLEPFSPQSSQNQMIKPPAQPALTNTVGKPIKPVVHEVKEVKLKSEPSADDAKNETSPEYPGYVLPDPQALTANFQNVEINKDELYENGALLEETLEQFGVKAKVIDIHPGPVITRYDLSPAPGVRVQSIETLSNDIALAMKAQSLRVLAPVPGKAAVGIEISNSHPAMVYLKEIVLSSRYMSRSGGIPLGIGKTTEGDAYVADLAAMPHLLIAGATGSGKSVCIHALILSILFRFRPDEVKLLLIDPKRLELPVYDGIPHLVDPATPPDAVRVITSSKDTVLSLKKLVDVMEMRYERFAKYGVRNIEGFNDKMEKENGKKEAYIVVIIDELADLMVVVGREIEELIQRLAQMARAVGIHLILATQRPSVDVITGVIKANLPCRTAFQVLSKTDSRVILDAQGAEGLLGRGDMLFLATGAPKPVRLQGCFVSEEDVNRVVQMIKNQNFKPFYEAMANDSDSDSVIDSPENKMLLVRAARVIRDTEKVSGDLLRADKEIGSKYDWALTLLRKRGLIEKPKDTNRWKIHFDRLSEFLDQVEQVSE